jgi:regulation of enolase protein 1 (concanavalin A-like superfamily)
MKSLQRGGALSAALIVCALLGNAQDTAAQALPSGWTSRDINAIGGSAISSNGTWTVSGSGANIWDAADGLQFTYRSAAGDFDFSARLTALDAPNAWSKAGLMVRESLNANARNAFMMYSPGTGPAFQYRTATDGATTRVAGQGGTLPVWLRLVRQGTQFTAYTSPNGSWWETIGSVTLSVGSTTYIGFGVGSRDVTAIARATFTNVSVQAPTSSPAPQPGGDWTSSDIGSPSLAGAYSVSGGTYTLTGAGLDVWGTTDQFRYAYQAVQGDIEIIARVATFDAPEEWSKAGVMIRQSLNANAANAFSVLSGSRGHIFQRRLAPGQQSDYAQGGTGRAPAWVRLVREGNLFSAYRSADGNSWTFVDSDTIAMSGTVYVGLAVTSLDPATAATATFTNVTVRTPNQASNQPPTVTLTAPSAGATFVAPATIAMSASANDPDGTISRVDFYRGSTLVSSDAASPYTATWSGAPAGTYALTAVAVDNEGATATSSAVTVTVNGSGNQPPTISFTSPSPGTTFTAPAAFSIQVAASDPDGTIARVDFYYGGNLVVSDTTSPYGYNVSNVAAGAHTVTAIARDNAGATQSAVITITVNSTSNQLPSVALTAPANGAAFTALATVNLQASASDADGTIARVEFYRGSTLIATDTTSPYTASWPNAAAGSYALTARAYDNNGASRTSTAINISIGSSANQPPTVTITSPSSANAYIAPASVTVTASATDPDGSITSVDFYVGTQLIGSDTTSPYSASWTNVDAGGYTLTARAHDNAGATTTSTAVTVNVSAASTPPTTAVFTASADHNTSLVTSYVVALYRSVDPVTASPVATRDLGKPTPSGGEISVDISTLVNPLPTGNYYAVVSARGSGGSSASTPSGIFAK